MEKSPLQLTMTNNKTVANNKRAHSLNSLSTRSKTTKKTAARIAWESTTSFPTRGAKLLMFEECPLPQSPRHPTVSVETWLSRKCCLGIPKWLTPFWLKTQVQGAYLGESREREPPAVIEASRVVCKKSRKRNHFHCIIKFLCEDSLRGTVGGYRVKGTIDCIPEEILGLDRRLSQEQRSSGGC